MRWIVLLSTLIASQLAFAIPAHIDCETAKGVHQLIETSESSLFWPGVDVQLHVEGIANSLSGKVSQTLSVEKMRNLYELDLSAQQIDRLGKLDGNIVLSDFSHDDSSMFYGDRSTHLFMQMNILNNNSPGIAILIDTKTLNGKLTMRFMNCQAI